MASTLEQATTPATHQQQDSATSEDRLPSDNSRFSDIGRHGKLEGTAKEARTRLCKKELWTRLCCWCSCELSTKVLWVENGEHLLIWNPTRSRGMDEISHFVFIFILLWSGTFTFSILDSSIPRFLQCWESCNFLLRIQLRLCSYKKFGSGLRLRTWNFGSMVFPNTGILCTLWLFAPDYDICSFHPWTRPECH